MITTHPYHFRVNRESNQIHVERSFDAPRPLVWSAWTEADILDQWWAPKPWKARTKSMDFREGGSWLYAMVGPENEEHWGRVDYVSISKEKSFTANEGFCDSDGILNTELPRNKWENQFLDESGTTTVKIVLTFDSLEDLEQIIQMGFREGFESGLNNLEEWLSTKANS
jgi:uncharacterized protein YndB with AHSA1/START domain